MSETGARLSEQVGQLRSAFDKVFAEPLAAAAAETSDLLAFSVGGEPYALRMLEIASVHADRKVTPMPSHVPAFMGLASVRGVVVPVYDLHVLLARPPVSAPRWTAIARDVTAGLAFEDFDGHLRVAREAIAPSDAGRTSRMVEGVASVEGVVRSIVSLPNLLEALAAQLRQTQMIEER